MRGCFQFWLACSLIAPAFAYAQDRVVGLEAPLQTTLGDPIDVSLTVSAEPSDEAAVPEQSFAPFEVVAKHTSGQTAADGKSKTITFELQLLCFEPGTHQLGPIHVRITSKAGQIIDLESESKQIEVQSVLANEPDPQLKPPTPPVTVEQDDYRLAIALGALGALLLGAFLTWLAMRWWRGRRRPEPLPPPAPPPWETALAELAALSERRANDVAEGRTEPWVDAVSDSVRKYLGQRFGFPGLESTTDEIARELSATQALAITPEEAVSFLAQCDLVKFARASLADEASRALIADAQTLVEKTRPATIPAEGGGP
ncbi:MAG: BatD family protein [Myxococcales bacterium]